MQQPGLASSGQYSIAAQQGIAMCSLAVTSDNDQSLTRELQ